MATAEFSRVGRVPRIERAEMVLLQLATYGPALTEYSLALGQGLTKSPYFRGIISDLVSDGLVVCQWAKGSNRQQTRYFSLPSQVLPLKGME